MEILFRFCFREVGVCGVCDIYSKSYWYFFFGESLKFVICNFLVIKFKLNGDLILVLFFLFLDVMLFFYSFF